MADAEDTPELRLISREEARAKGLGRFFTGRPCKRGHIAERNVSSPGCVVCASEYQKTYRLEPDNLERERARGRHRRLTDPEKHRRSSRERGRTPKGRAGRKAWKARNRAKVAESNKAYNERNAPVVRLKSMLRSRRRNQQARRKKDALWRTKNPFAVSANNSRARARKWGSEGTHTAEELRDLLEGQGFMCAGCGGSIQDRSDRHADHKTPLSRGGSNWIGNMQWLCCPCNTSKNRKTQDEWEADKAEKRRTLADIERRDGPSEVWLQILPVLTPASSF